ncbi:MAG: class I SAM-dependent methyltransferase [Candidatus Diapherotrites archaeon]|nr:class I SAM-dependent methyltransferase [Candidatus Diapherotrites archaeon]
MQYYSAISRSYNELHGIEQLGKAELIKKHAALHGLLLDIGAGTGIATEQFAQQAQCIALDPCKEMLRHFNGVKVVGRAEQLPFKSSSFDSVISITALHHARLGKANREIARVAKQNAVVAVSFFKRARNFSQAAEIFRNFRRIDSEKDVIFIK